MRKIGLWLIASVVLAVLVSCGASGVSLDAIDDGQPQLSQPPQLTRAEILALQHLEVNHEITVEELQARLRPFLGGGLGRSAMGTQSVVAGVERHVLTIEDGFVQRGRSDMRVSEIPFYVFTLENEADQTRGFALASGDARVGCIFAVVEYGEIDTDIPFNRMFFSMLVDYVAESVYLFNSVTVDDIQAAIERRDEIAGFATRSNARLTVPQNAIGPLLRTTWDQGAPYSDVINSIYGLQPRDGFVVGCVAVALAQLAAFHRHPARPLPVIRDPRYGRFISSFIHPHFGSTVSFSDLTYDWSSMTIARRASNLFSGQHQMLVGVLMFEIASNANMNFGTSQSVTNVTAGLLQNMGFRTPTMDPYNMMGINASIRAGRPVYITGMRRNSNVGHAWIIDGFFLSGLNFFVHCNLGWGGLSDGWYRSGVFDTGNVPIPTQRPPWCIGDRDRPGGYLEPPWVWVGGPAYNYNLWIWPDIHPNR